ncbi:hypothetical protein ACQ4PT_012191 [Festuca glaucescens]
MSSSGDPTQLDGQALLELQNASAAKIQRYWKALQLRRLEARESFCRTLSTLVQNVDWNCFGPDSDFLRQLLFFFNAKRGEDVDMLCKICDILLLYVRSDGDLVTLFAGGVDSSRVKSVVVYSHILQFMDIVELKKSERYVSLEDLPSLVFILKEALWELLLTIPLQSSSLQTTCSPLDNKKMLTQVLKSSVMTGLCELLIQLEKWNNMDQFVPPIGFCSTKAISDEFASQALIVGTHEAEIIRLAPFLVPFDTRLEIFQLRLEADHLLMGNSRQYFGSRTLEIRRTNLLKDAFNNISLLSAEDLKGRVW